MGKGSGQCDERQAITGGSVYFTSEIEAIVDKEKQKIGSASAEDTIKQYIAFDTDYTDLFTQNKNGIDRSARLDTPIKFEIPEPKPIEPIRLSAFKRKHQGFTIFATHDVIEPAYDEATQTYTIGNHMHIENGTMKRMYPDSGYMDEAGPIALLYDTSFANFKQLRDAVASLLDEKVNHRLLRITYGATSQTDGQNYAIQLTRKIQGGWSIYGVLGATLIQDHRKAEFPTRQAAIDAFNETLARKGLLLPAEAVVDTDV